MGQTLKGGESEGTFQAGGWAIAQGSQGGGLASTDHPETQVVWVGWTMERGQSKLLATESEGLSSWYN